MPEQLQITATPGTLTLPIAGFCVIENLHVLWPGPPARGRNRTLSHRNGSIPYPRRNAERRRLLSLVVEGQVDHAGVAHANPGREGLELNLAHLRSYFDPDDTGDGTLTLALTMPSGAIRSGPATVEDFDYDGLGPAAVQAVLDLTLTDGALV